MASTLNLGPPWWRMPREWASFRPRSLPIITVRKGAWAIRALADTGAQTSLVHPRLVLQFGLPTIGELPIVGIGSAVARVSRVQLTELHVARRPLSTCEAGVVNLDNLRLGIDLILGISAFVGYRLQFDFRAGRLYLFSE
jgi:aspartyl protease